MSFFIIWPELVQHAEILSGITGRMSFWMVLNQAILLPNVPLLCHLSYPLKKKDNWVRST